MQETLFTNDQLTIYSPEFKRKKFNLEDLCVLLPTNRAPYPNDVFYHNLHKSLEFFYKTIRESDVLLSDEKNVLFNLNQVLKIDPDIQSKPFLMVDVSSMIKKISDLSSLLKGIKLSYHLKDTMDPVLASMLMNLDVCVTLDNQADIEMIKEAIQMMQPTVSTSETCANPMSVLLSQSAFGHFSVDMCDFRPNALMTKSIKAGTRVMNIHSMSCVRRIVACVKQLNTSSSAFPLRFPDVIIHFDPCVVTMCTSDLQNGCAVAINYCATVEDVKDIFAYCQMVDVKCVGFNVSFNTLCSHSDALEMLFQLIPGSPVLFINNMDELVATKDSMSIRAITSMRDVFACHNVSIVGNITSYLLHNTHDLITNVIAVKPLVNAFTGVEEGQHVYVNDGVYGCLVDNNPSGKAFTIGSDVSRVLSTTINSMATVIWGQTCDSIDKIAERSMPELSLQDRVVFKTDHGAAYATVFNGYSLPCKKYVFHMEDEFSDL